MNYLQERIVPCPTKRPVLNLPQFATPGFETKFIHLKSKDIVDLKRCLQVSASELGFKLNKTKSKSKSMSSGEQKNQDDKYLSMACSYEIYAENVQELREAMEEEGDLLR